MLFIATLQLTLPLIFRYAADFSLRLMLFCHAACRLPEGYALCRRAVAARAPRYAPYALRALTVDAMLRYYAAVIAIRYAAAVTCLATAAVVALPCCLCCAADAYAADKRYAAGATLIYDTPCA